MVKTLAEDGDIGERTAEGGEKQAKTPRSLDSIGGRHWASPEERRRDAGRKDRWESLALWTWGCPQTLTMPWSLVPTGQFVFGRRRGNNETRRLERLRDQKDGTRDGRLYPFPKPRVSNFHICS